jgi:hypothetical protein
MTTPTSSSIGIPAGGERRGSRRVSAAALNDLEEPRPPGGWNTLERFATSYQRSTTFFRIDAGSPASSFVYRGSGHPGIPDFDDDGGDHVVFDEDEETGLLRRGSRQGTRARPSQSSFQGEEVGDVEDHFAQFRGASSPKPGDDTFYGSIRRGSRRPSMLDSHGAPDLLIKEVQDEAGNIIEIVVGQVRFNCGC